MRNPHAGEPFTDSAAAIAAALTDVSIPALLMSCVHMTDDDAVRAAIVEGPLRPAGLFLNEVQGFMSEEAQAAARALALEIITDYRDRGCPEPRPVPPALLKRMMDWIAAGEVPDEYVPMMLEEMELDGADNLLDDLVSNPDTRADFPVLVIRCGQSGLLAGIRLKQAGVPFTVIEKNPGVGGTWWENRYPGARVDVGNHFYCYSFEPADHWSEFFARQPELQSYFADVMARHGVEEHVRFDTEVSSAVWEEATGTWAVSVHGPDGPETLRARAVISAVGQLNAPFIPDFPGKEIFTGPAFHTARWDATVDLTGKNVVMIGAGASGFQIAPAIADTVGHLTIIQRTAQWMFPNPNYHAAVGPGMRWAIKHLPFYGRWYRFLIFWPGCDTGLAAAKVDPDWPDQQRAVSAANDMARMMFTQWITSQLDGAEDAEALAAKVIPDYPATGKRTLQDNGSWLRTLRRDNVELVRGGVERIERDGVVDSNGRKHHADVIVYATGFRVNDFLSSLTVTGRDGVELHEAWGERPAAYLGISIPGFPNFFCMYGPGTNLASGGSLIFHSECQIRYIVGCIDLLLASGHRSLEPTRPAYDDWYDRCQAELQTMVWSQPSIAHSFYKDARGVVHSLSPWRLVDYWSWTRTPDPADYVMR
ncbi:MAG: NAD(P)/FAD-dependent oxidoreductase [Mycobacterium sp.]|nr:NAD(P)/FAD-dependent oxidoreductase [Mycobacterium sp.]